MFFNIRVVAPHKGRLEFKLGHLNCLVSNNETNTNLKKKFLNKFLFFIISLLSNYCMSTLFLNDQKKKASQFYYFKVIKKDL